MVHARMARVALTLVVALLCLANANGATLPLKLVSSNLCLSVVNASTLLAYAFYTTDPETVAKFGTDRLLWTIPFPLYGIFRYLYLVHQREGGGDPSEMLATDVPLLICGALWIAAIIAVLYAPR